MNIYFDCAASAPVLPCAMDALTTWPYANPNSVHRLGRDARICLEHYRAEVARCINAEPDEIFFTPSATAACREFLNWYEVEWFSPHEHKAVSGFFDNYTVINSWSGAVAHILASNETGELFCDEVKALVAQGKTVFTDATAAVGHHPIDVKELGVEGLAAGGHKFGAPPGIGFLYVKGGLVVGDGLAEKDFSYPGTPPVALAGALASALKYRTRHMGMTETTLEQRVALGRKLEQIPGAHINVREKPRLPHILSVRFDGVNARELLTLLDVNGVCASAGSACHAEDDRPSAALLASGLTEEQARSTIRLSWCEETTGAECDAAADIIAECVERLRSLGGVTT